MTGGPRPRIGLALAGGGPLGAIYEIGALCALEDAVTGLDLRRCDSYIGVSAGGFIAAGLANGLGPRRLREAFIDEDGDGERFDPSLLLRPAWDEYLQRAMALPGLLAAAGWDLLRGRALLAACERLGRALPTGLLSGEAFSARLHQLFSRPGRSDDFRRLKRRLVLVATDLDSGEAVPFGMPGWDHVPISRAVQASAALPGLFPPVEIDGRHFVDGALKKTVHASVLLREGLDLLICLNPLVPYASGAPAQPADRRIPRLAAGGLPLVLSQTLRSLIHSRLELGMRGYSRSHPGTDILLLEPDKHDAELFLANTFSYARRQQLAEHAYRRTCAQLLRRADALAPMLARHGLRLRVDWLRARCHDTLPAAAQRPGLQAALQRLTLCLDRLEQRHGVATRPTPP
ncbi:patatin-like phospholipase family protein [Pelomonas sp. CA6]|uniref:patatin-like phospholipase family protein n=1 Tax=Pelomonas sp. CA6 TaxID=2907999 RepID=UPI001F4B3076|nr:patatin-like phospholipase family protein [Pelomonas sp. CA6]MCH7341895.1 patatin-like phospholipase family protein [Pelomonas sp. CA6]